MSYATILMAWSVLAGLEGKETARPADGLAELGAAVAHLDRIPQGRVEFRRVRLLPGDRVIEREHVGLFNGARFRLDVISDSGWDALYQRLGMTPEFLARNIWDGERVLTVERDHRILKWSMSDPDRLHTHVFDVRQLGLPLARTIGVSGAEQYAQDFRLIERTVEGDLVRVQCLLRRPTNDGDRSLGVGEFVIDPAKGPSILSYEISEMAYDTKWTLKGEFTPAQFGKVWFPSYARMEQSSAGGQHDWVQEYHVVNADFATAVPPGELDWAALKLFRGAFIRSDMSGVLGAKWDGQRAVPYTQFK